MGKDCVKLLVSDALTRNYIVVKDTRFVHATISCFKTFNLFIARYMSSFDMPFSSAFSTSQDYNSSLS